MQPTDSGNLCVGTAGQVSSMGGMGEDESHKVCCSIDKAACTSVSSVFFDYQTDWEEFSQPQFRGDSDVVNCGINDGSRCPELTDISRGRLLRNR